MSGVPIDLNCCNYINELLSSETVMKVMEENLNEQAIDNLKRENEKLLIENKKAKKILKELIEQLSEIHSNLATDKRLNLEKEHKDAETIKKLQISNYQLNEKINNLEAENSQLKAFKNEFVNRAKSLDNNSTIQTSRKNSNEESTTNITNNIDSSGKESNDSNEIKKQKKKGAKKFNFPSKAVEVLIEKYKSNKFPDNSEIKSIADEIKLTPQQVNKWFRDRRHKLEETKVILLIILLLKLKILNQFFY